MSDTTALSITKEDGVHDLPVKVRLPFARALLAEREGRYAEAESYLADALKAEAETRAA